ncbi:hypothetical protein R1sor_020841 [Riccia sorocarpa]|uniref:Uncharacterized protein n=1 Tax=Riccia sorocarpa TaxID=122646 RepID=A0ABD3GIH2_9MARC
MKTKIRRKDSKEGCPEDPKTRRSEERKTRRSEDEDSKARGYPNRKYLSHLDFFIEAKAGRFFGSKKSDRRQILLSSITGLEEELKKVKTYLFWKRRQFRRLSFTPKLILMAPKAKKDRLAKTPPKVSTPKKTPPPPSTSNPSTPKAKMGPCKQIALPTTELKKFQPQLEELGIGFLFWRWDYTAEPLVKEFFLLESEVALPHREKPHEWTVAHYRRMLGRTKEQEELGIVWDTVIQRLNMPEGVNPDDLFEEKRKQNDKNGYKTKTYVDPIRRVIDESLMAFFFPNALKTVGDGSPIYIGAFLAHLHLKNEWLTAEERSLYEEVDPYSKISADYSSDEDEDDTSDEEEEKTEEAKEVGEVVKDTESDEDEDEGGNKDKAQVEDKSPPPSPTSPNYSPDQIVAKPMRRKKRKVIRFGEMVAKKKASKETSKEEVNKDNAREEESEGVEKKAELLTQIIEDGPSQVHTSTPRPSVSINLTAYYLSRYFVTPFATLEEIGKKFYKNFTPGPDHLNTVNELVKRLKEWEELTPKLFKATQRTKTAEEEKRVALEYEKLKDQEKASLEDRVKKLEGKVEAIEKEKVSLVEEGKKKDKKIKNLQVQWIARQEVEDKEVILGNLRDAVKTILANLKETPAKEKKKIAFAQLAEQVKGDYETVLKKHRNDFERFRTSLLSETAALSTSGGKSSS